MSYAYASRERPLYDRGGVGRVEPMEAGSSRELDRARRLERGLIRVRWFAVVLGLYLIRETNSGLPPYASKTVLLLGYLIIAALGVGNVLIWIGASRCRTLLALQRLGWGAFLMDAVVIFSVAWIFSYDPKGSTWVVIYILPLEGALRYQLEGSLMAVAITMLNEVGREAYLAVRFPDYPFLVANVAFRVGIQFIIALVAGFMSRSLARQADRATWEAHQAEEAARREASARGELAAFNTAILTGVAAEDLDTSIQLMAGAIGRDLQYEAFTILLRDGDDLIVKGMYGMPFYEERIPLGKGITGTVAATGRALIVQDVTKHDNYVLVDAEMRSEMAAPMRIGDELIGVLDVESRTPNAFDEPSLGVLNRLADQIALVAHSNRLLSQQRETMRRLQELDQMKSDFIAITSHELRTPITAIRGFVNTLQRNQDRLTSEQLTNFMQIIDRQSARLARLVEDLLFVSRIEAGTIRFQTDQVELARFLAETTESLGPEERSRVHVDVQPPGSTVRTDPHRLDQILRNLVENALKFSPPDAPVRIDAMVRDDWFQLAVADQGVGIPAEDLPRIFDRFHQVGQAMTRETEGAGLGLYITKRLVEAMGGTITVASVPGRGATFRIWLPANIEGAYGEALGEPEVAAGQEDGDRTRRRAAEPSGITPAE
ncbi:MAG TPA: ATP-binding protein [Actinomycetota bacterium]|nr:ATP-binding protein [Actinomycetota bacterium]